MRKLTSHELQRLSPQACQATKKFPFVMVLDNVRSAHNVGAIFRIADAFLLEKLYLCGITGTPPHQGIHKTALGAEATVDWAHTQDTPGLLTQLKATGYCIVAVEQTDQALPLQEFSPLPTQKYCLVFGHEVSGISEAALEACDLCLEIPQYGMKHSLNIAVSVGIVGWELVKKFRQQHSC